MHLSIRLSIFLLKRWVDAKVPKASTLFYKGGNHDTPQSLNNLFININIYYYIRKEDIIWLFMKSIII